MDDDARPTRQEISDAVGPLGWRLVLGSIYAEVLTTLEQAAQAASTAVSAAGADGQGHLTVDVRADRAVLRLHCAAVGAVTGRDIRLAGVISDSLPTTPAGTPVQGMEIAIDALDIPAVRPFWKAITDFVDEPDLSGGLIDPFGRGPAIWFQQMDAPRPQRNRIHLDIDVPHDAAQARIAAALAAGGTLLSDAAAPAFWALATPRAMRPASAPGGAGTEAHALRLSAVITRMSELFLRTLRDDPADAEVPSHKLLIRAGYIRPVGPGLYSWLPLGLRVLRKIEKVVRDEMNAIGGQEILFPALLPKAPYEVTNRWTEYGDGLFRLQDRRGNDYLLGPTHEELVHPDGEGGVQQLQGFPAAGLPNPDQVPRRGAAARRHPAGPRVRHEGLVLVRCRRRRPCGGLSPAPRRLPADLRHAGGALRHRLGGVRGDGWQRVRGVPCRKRDR